MKVAAMIAGEPLQITLAQRVVRPDGKQRSITQKVRVPDSLLALRLNGEVKLGDEIEVSIVTEWTENGYSTYLSDYRLISASSAETEAEISQLAHSS